MLSPLQAPAPHPPVPEELGLPHPAQDLQQQESEQGNSPGDGGRDVPVLGMTAGPQLLLLLPSELQLLSCWPRSAAGTWGGREAAAAAPLQPWAGCSPPPELCNKPEPAVLVWSVPAGEGMGLLPCPQLQNCAGSWEWRAAGHHSGWAVPGDWQQSPSH